MRIWLSMLPLLVLASPSAAQAPDRAIAIPPELVDPAVGERLGVMMEAMSRAFLDMPIGEIEAAAEGRPATPADRNRRIRDVADAADVERQVARAGPMVEQATKAFARALPAMSRALSEVAVQMERAVENMPRPDYPRR